MKKSKLPTKRLGNSDIWNWQRTYRNIDSHRDIGNWRIWTHDTVTQLLQIRKFSKHVKLQIRKIPKSPKFHATVETLEGRRTRLDLESRPSNNWRDGGSPRGRRPQREVDPKGGGAEALVGATRTSRAPPAPQLSSLLWDGRRSCVSTAMSHFNNKPCATFFFSFL